ncbi:hypothetical protein ACRE_074360 [Hapsidospora chrysogenum ATCC 11550]|uniref:Uncharacterized protein n=1 Tax=Hapsidospora chrysogenum (strain ATCC 11550 / CBS 779.69 / DSM 880 / IAM 14645 / JCM 23072 / IMI 49137) TaxID=857340 RepID=A0A086SXN0_HAPC1|nr:hypothetical protein ACRE_074360 [Hapsidospora chrysogenum ATCC 11550]
MSINNASTKESSASRGLQEEFGITLSGCLRVIADAIDRIEPTRFMPALPTWRPTNPQLFDLVISELITIIRDDSEGLSAAEFYDLDFPGVALRKITVMGRRDHESMTAKSVDKGKAPMRASGSTGSCAPAVAAGPSSQMSNYTASPSRAGGPSSSRQERAPGPSSNSPVLATPLSPGIPRPPSAPRRPRPSGISGISSTPRIHGGLQPAPINPLAYGYGSRYGYAPPNYHMPPNYTSPNNMLPAMYPSPQAYSSPSSVYPPPGLPTPHGVHMQPTTASANIHTAGVVPASNGQFSSPTTPVAHAGLGSPTSMDVQINAGSRNHNDKPSWQPLPNAPYTAVRKQTAPKTAGPSDNAANTQIADATKEQTNRRVSPYGQPLRLSSQPTQPLSQQSPFTTNAVNTEANREVAADVTPAQIQSSSAEKRKAEVLDRVEECRSAVIVHRKPETLGEVSAPNTSKVHVGAVALDEKEQVESSPIGRVKSPDVSEKPQAKSADVVKSSSDTSGETPADGASSDERAPPIETEFPFGLGSTDPCPTAVHIEPFPTPAEKKPQNRSNKELDKSAAAADQIKSKTAAITEDAETEIKAPSSPSSCDAWSAMSGEFPDWEVIDRPKDPSPAVKKSFRDPDGRRGSENANGFRAKESGNQRRTDEVGSSATWTDY